MRRRTMPRRREDPPKPQLSYFTKSDGKLARVRATARALSSVSSVVARVVNAWLRCGMLS